MYVIIYDTRSDLWFIFVAQSIRRFYVLGKEKNRMKVHRQASRASLLCIVDAIKRTLETSSDEDEVSHAKLLDDIHALTLEAETPLDTLYRIGYQVGIPSLVGSSRGLGCNCPSKSIDIR